MAYDEWRVALFRITQVISAARFWFGSWVLAGEAMYGETAVQAVSETGLSENTIMTYRTVAAKMPDLIRISELSWSHHRVIAYADLKDEKERAEWLEKSRHNGWNVRELEEALSMAGKRKTRHKETAEVVALAGASGVQVFAGGAGIDALQYSNEPSTCPCCHESAGTVLVCEVCFDSIVAMAKQREKVVG